MEDNTDKGENVANKNGSSGIIEDVNKHVGSESDQEKIENKEVKFDIKEDTDRKDKKMEKDGADMHETADKKKKLRVVGMRNGEYKNTLCLHLSKQIVGNPIN